MDNVLMPTEIEFYVELIKPQEFHSIGTKSWLEWHQRLQKLNQQALIEAASLRDEQVKEVFVLFNKVPVLVHEAIQVNIWKHKVLPLLLDLEPNPQHTFLAYTVLYHEAIAVALLELVLFHANCCETLNDYASDLLDYATGSVSQLLSVQHTDPPPQKSECGKIELLRQSHNLTYEIGIRSLAIIRYIAEYLERLPLDVSSKIFTTYDVPTLFVQLLLTKPWIKDGNKQFVGGKWVPWDGEVVSRTEGQVWITLHQLLLGEGCRTYYRITETHRTQLVKLLMLLTPILLDQLSPLIELKTWISHISIAEQPTTTKRPIILESVLEIKKQILEQIGGKWKKIAKQQVPIIFPDDQTTLLENAQILNDAYNTDLLEKFEQVNLNTCEECGKEAIQRCSNCKNAWYCSRSCQITHWPKHKCVS